MNDAKFNQLYNEGQTIGTSALNTADELEKLHSLKEKGIITNEEFEQRKKKLL
jgi:predicted PilT family ATPase